MPQIVSNYIEGYLKSKSKDSFEHKDRLYPTFASVFVNYGKYKRLEGKCLRAAFYHCIGSESVNNKSIQEVLGEYVEDMLINMFKDQGILSDRAVRFSIDEYNIHGKLDAIINIDSVQFGVEIKSIGGNNKWVNNQIFGSIYNKPYPKWQHLLQTIIYCYAFREKLDSGFILLYIRRDTGECKEFLVSIEIYNGEMYIAVDGNIDFRFKIKDILDRYKALATYIKENKTPPKEYMKIYPKENILSYYKLGIISKKQLDNYYIEAFGDYCCKYCEYKDLCDKDN
jgi:hypothetical protein